jgi:hypothetical protein
LINTGGAGWAPRDQGLGWFGTLVSADADADGSTDLISFTPQQQVTVWFNRSQPGMPGFEPQSAAWPCDGSAGDIRLIAAGKRAVRQAETTLPALAAAAADRGLRTGLTPLLAGDFCRNGGTMLLAADREDTITPGKLRLLASNRGLDWGDESAARLPGLQLLVKHAAAGDINGDSYPDLFLGTGDSDNPPVFLINDSSGRFSGEN